MPAVTPTAEPTNVKWLRIVVVVSFGLGVAALAARLLLDRPCLDGLACGASGSNLLGIRFVPVTSDFTCRFTIGEVVRTLTFDDSLAVAVVPTGLSICDLPAVRRAVLVKVVSLARLAAIRASVSHVSLTMEIVFGLYLVTDAAGFSVDE